MSPAGFCHISAAACLWKESVLGLWYQLIYINSHYNNDLNICCQCLFFFFFCQAVTAKNVFFSNVACTEMKVIFPSVLHYCGTDGAVSAFEPKDSRRLNAKCLPGLFLFTCYQISFFCFEMIIH